MEQEYKPIEWIEGNAISLALPLQKVEITPSGKVVSDYVPDGTVEVLLKSAYKNYRYTPTLDGNLCIFSDNGTLRQGIYTIEILSTEDDGTKRRSQYPRVIIVHKDSTKLLEAFEDFPDYAEGAVLDTPSIFFAVGGGGGTVDAYTKAQSDARYVKKVDMQAYSTTEELLENIRQTLLGYATIQYVDEKVQQVSSAWDVVEALDGTVTLEPHKYYVCGERDTLEIEVGAAITDGKLNEYMFEFDSPVDSPTILDMPQTIYSPVSLGIESGKKYIVRIIGRYMMISGGTEGYNYADDLSYQILNRTAQYLQIPAGIREIETRQFINFTRLQEIELPSSIVSIGANAFQNCSSLTHIIIPENVKTIGASAFQGCESLQTVDIQSESDITIINSNTFQGCSSLKHITIPKSVITIGSSAFNGCSQLEEVELPDTVTTFGQDVFYNCSSLKHIDLPATFTILNRAFYGCSSLESIVVPDSVYTLTGSVFYMCSKLSSVVIEGSVTTLQSGCFYGTAITSFPDIRRGTVTTIQGNCFGDCKNLQEITIPEGVTLANGGLFDGCLQLRSVTLPSTMQNFGANYVFRNCPMMEVLTVHDTITTLNVNGSLQNLSLRILGTSRVIPVPTSLNAASKVYVDDTMVAMYKASSAWRATEGRIYPLSEYTE